jgi:hypothetical protein
MYIYIWEWLSRDYDADREIGGWVRKGDGLVGGDVQEGIGSGMGRVLMYNHSSCGHLWRL